jgi:dipeptidyl-peptidase-4
MVRRLGLILFCICSLVFAAGKKPVTLEDLSSESAPPMGGSPVWAPDGKRFIDTAQGKLWLYDVPSRKKTELVPTGAFRAAATKEPPAERFDFENRRVNRRLAQWSPSGRELLITAGDLFLFRIGVRGWTQLTATPEPERDAKLSPDGKLVSFRRGHDLYVLDAATLKETRLTADGSDTILNGEPDWVYPEELELGTAHWWSPDSKSIAYLQFDVSREPLYPQVELARPRAVLEPQRYPRAGDPNADVRLGVVPAAGGPTRWMDLGESRDELRARFYWLPDSQGIMVERLNRIQTELDVVIADAKTGKSRVILRESDKDWVNIQGDPVFLKGGREFLWESERDGFNHIYRYSIEGKLLGRLTQGDWEVSSVAGVDEAGGQVYFVSSEAGPLERQFYRVGLSGGARTRLSKGAGTHTISMSPGCEYYLDSYSNLSTPARRTLHTKDGAEWAVYSEPDRRQLEEYDILPSEIIEVKAADGTVLYARMIKPASFDPAKKYPVIVNVYGGPHAQSVRNSWPGGVTLDQVFAHRGYIVWELDNRGTSGRGHKFEVAVSRNLGGKEVDDQKDGVRHLLSLGFADPKRVGIRGWSYGGYMTLRSLLLAPEVFACGVAGAPVADWRNYDSIYTERYMGLPSENVEGYNRSSNVLEAGKLKGKLLIAHNFEDDNVLFQNTMQMVEALQRAGKQFELMVYTNKSHGLMRGRDHFDALTVSFFDRWLK